MDSSKMAAQWTLQCGVKENAQSIVSAGSRATEHGRGIAARWRCCGGPGAGSRGRASRVQRHANNLKGKGAMASLVARHVRRQFKNQSTKNDKKETTSNPKKQPDPSPWQANNRNSNSKSRPELRGEMCQTDTLHRTLVCFFSQFQVRGEGEKDVKDVEFWSEGFWICTCLRLFAPFWGANFVILGTGEVAFWMKTNAGFSVGERHTWQAGPDAPANLSRNRAAPCQLRRRNVRYQNKRDRSRVAKGTIGKLRLTSPGFLPRFSSSIRFSMAGEWLTIGIGRKDGFRVWTCVWSFAASERPAATLRPPRFQTGIARRNHGTTDDGQVRSHYNTRNSDREPPANQRTPRTNLCRAPEVPLRLRVCWCSATCVCVRAWSQQWLPTVK